jgi:hypothetical protein
MQRVNDDFQIPPQIQKLQVGCHIKKILLCEN